MKKIAYILILLVGIQ